MFEQGGLVSKVSHPKIAHAVGQKTLFLNVLERIGATFFGRRVSDSQFRVLDEPKLHDIVLTGIGIMSGHVYLKF